MSLSVSLWNILIYFRSNSINRSASALAALIRVSLTIQRKDIYVNIARIEPMFHLERLAGSLACSDPDKKWILLLVKLARETVVAVIAPSVEESFNPILGKAAWELWPSPETALQLHQRLIQALKLYRCALTFLRLSDEMRQFALQILWP